MTISLNLLTKTGPLMRSYAFIVCSAVLVSHGVFAQSSGTQALSKEDLNQINNQPLAPSSRKPAGLSVKEKRNPSFEYTDPSGTQIREYRDSNLPPELEVNPALVLMRCHHPKPYFQRVGCHRII